jgi:hypothetical protein
MKGDVVVPLTWIAFVIILSRGWLNSVVQTVLVSVNFNPSSAPPATNSGNAGFKTITGGAVTPSNGGSNDPGNLIPGSPTNPIGS